MTNIAYDDVRNVSLLTNNFRSPIHFDKVQVIEVENRILG